MNLLESVSLIALVCCVIFFAIGIITWLNKRDNDDNGDNDDNKDNK